MRGSATVSQRRDSRDHDTFCKIYNGGQELPATSMNVPRQPGGERMRLMDRGAHCSAPRSSHPYGGNSVTSNRRFRSRCMCRCSYARSGRARERRYCLECVGRRTRLRRHGRRAGVRRARVPRASPLASRVRRARGVSRNGGVSRTRISGPRGRVPRTSGRVSRARRRAALVSMKTHRRSRRSEVSARAGREPWISSGTGCGRSRPRGRPTPAMSRRARPTRRLGVPTRRLPEAIPARMSRKTSRVRSRS